MWNDAFLAGNFGEIAHFNGAGWRNYRQQLGLPNAVFGKVELRHHLVLAVGFTGTQALILKGTR